MATKTTANPVTQAALEDARRNFDKYVKVTGDGYEARKPIPRGVAIGYMRGRLLEECKFLPQAFTLEEWHLIAETDNCFDPGCIALMTPKCGAANCKAYGIKMQRHTPSRSASKNRLARWECSPFAARSSGCP
jgi:hypothetical protein